MVLMTVDAKILSLKTQIANNDNEGELHEA